MILPPLETLLAQAPPMLLLDEIRSWDGDELCCTASLRGDSPFIKDGRMSSLASVDYMFQCASALHSLYALQAKQTLEIPRLLGVHRMRCYKAHLESGQELEVRATRVWQSKPGSSYRCAIRQGAERSSEAHLTIHHGPWRKEI